MTQSLPPALATLAVILLGMADARYLLVRLPDMGGIMPPPPDIPSPTIMPPPTLLTAATPPPPTAATPHSHMTMAPQPPPVVPTVPPRWVQQYPQYQPPQQYPIDPPYYYDASSYGDGYGEMAWRKGRSKGTPLRRRRRHGGSRHSNVQRSLLPLALLYYKNVMNGLKVPKGSNKKRHYIS